MESDAEEGLQQWIAGEVDAWVVGKRVRHSGVDGRDKWRVGEKKSAGGSVLRAAWDSGEGGGSGNGDAMWRGVRGPARRKAEWAEPGETVTFSIYSN
jgi:hypothetical protein